MDNGCSPEFENNSLIKENIFSNDISSQNIISEKISNCNSQMIDFPFFGDFNLVNDNCFDFSENSLLLSFSNNINYSFIYNKKDNYYIDNNNSNYFANENSIKCNNEKNNNDNNKENINHNNENSNNESEKEKEIIILINNSRDINISNTNYYINKKRPRHDRLAKDNIKRKINVYYSKFVWSLLNEIIKQLLNENIKFCRISYSFLKDVTHSAFNSLKNKTLGDIFKANVSPKNKNSDESWKYLNTEVYNKVTSKSKILKNILNKPYLEFFKDFLLHNKILNLSKYDLNKYILLLNNNYYFEDLKNNNKTNDLIADQIYFNKLRTIINENFIYYPVFKTINYSKKY